MQIQDSKRTNIVSTILLYAAPVAGVGSFYLFQKDSAVNMFSDFIIALILAGVYYTFLHVNQNYFYGKISGKLLYFGSFFLSFLLLGGKAGLPLGVFFMLAAVVAALDGGLEIALATHISLMVQYALLLLPQEDGFYRFLAYILLGFVVSLLFSQLQERKAIPYLALILLACGGVLQCVIYQFNLEEMYRHLKEIIVEGISLLVFVGIGFIYLAGKGKPEAEPEPEYDSLALESEPESDAVTVGQALLQQVTESDFELMERLSEYSSELYQHCLQIAELSAGAVAAVGGDTLLAKAGGIYHEVGRLENEKDYIEAGTRLGQEYGFPEELLAVMRQHSTGFELPQSVEAAAVMLSDCIISTSDFLEKNGKREKISDTQLVTSIFQNRLNKGDLAQAGMTEEQIGQLQEFYIEHTFTEVQGEG